MTQPNTQVITAWLTSHQVTRCPPGARQRDSKIDRPRGGVMPGEAFDNLYLKPRES